MDIDSLTYAQIKELRREIGGNASQEPSSGHPWKIGENYLIRTVTMIQVGRLESVGEHELLLSSAAWVADTDRFYTALKTGKLKEVEPFLNDVIVGRGSIVDACIWTHKLPREQV